MEGYLPIEPDPHQEELDLCAADPIYFITNYCKSVDPRKPVGERITSFIPFDMQVEAIRTLLECDETQTGSLWEKSRDSGATFIAVYYALWNWLFKAGDVTGFGSLKFDNVDNLGDPKCIFEKLRATYRQLPDWMREARSKGFVWSKHSTIGKFLNPQNESAITGEGGDNVGRGGRCSRYFIDEAAHLEHPKLIDASLSQNTDVRHDISTPKGLEEFYLKRQSGLVKVVRMHWLDDPRKWAWEARNSHGNLLTAGTGRHPTEPPPSAYEEPRPDARGIMVLWPWYERQRLRPEYIDPAILAQEVDIDYIGTGRPRFNRAWLLRMRETTWNGSRYSPEWSPERIETSRKTAWMGDLTTFVDSEPKHTYALLVDTARGLTESGTADYSVFHVFDLSTCEQVVHYRGQMSEYEFATDIAVVAAEYNNALVVVETPGPGETVLSHLSNVIKYRPLYSHWDNDAQGTVAPRYGLPMTPTTKPEGDGNLASMLYDAEQGIRGAIILRHPNTFEECVHYVRLTREKCGAEAGGHDDEVACLRLFAMIWQTHCLRGRKAIADLEPRQARVSAPTHMGHGISGQGGMLVQQRRGTRATGGRRARR